MLENYENPVSVGLPVSKPEVISPLERGEAPWTLGAGVPRGPCPDYLSREARCETKDSVLTEGICSGTLAQERLPRDSNWYCRMGESEEWEIRLERQEGHQERQSQQVTTTPKKPFNTRNVHACSTLISHLNLGPIFFPQWKERFQKYNTFGKKAFGKKSHLNIQQTIHFGENPFECDVCWKTFRNRETLSKHRRTHTGAKLFESTQSGKSFSDDATCIGHQKTHSQRKPFECGECGKSLTTKKPSLIIRESLLE
ncbi:zinc finger protein 470-like isoform X1 [Trichosurus vulpecula]|uniref:zinc finger protein 470-like isoform X1 n=1 Tax=Trichosurus vulpecula TaxID=9337 RepID=UPI00186AF672|nr:zinc finger protein 470-like isoform X1 [Trichosurus vulpecula]